MFENSSIKQQIIKKATEYKNNELFKKFIDAFYSYIPVDNQSDIQIDEFCEIAVSTYKNFLSRQAGESKVSISACRKNVEDKTAHNIVHIVNDDMPFIVDSVSEILFKRKYRVSKMVNALMHVERDKNGKAISIATVKEKKPNESVIFIRIIPVKSNEALKRLAAEIKNVLENVKYAVSDWKNMVVEAEDAKSWLDNSNFLDDPIENKNFLNWLIDDNFTFIGFREYDFSKAESQNNFELSIKKSFGVTRVEDSEFNQNLVEDIFASDINIWRNCGISIGKIREVSKVHRYSSYDYVCVIKREGESIVSAKIFLGLFVSRLEYQSVTNIPIIRKKVDSIVDRGGFEKSSFNGKELFSIVETLPRDELFQLSGDELFLTSMMIMSCLNNPRLIVFVRESRCKVFVNLLVFFPKSRLTSDITDKITSIIKKYIPGKLIGSKLNITSMNLAYVQISMKVKNNRELDIDIPKIEYQLDKTTSLWIEKFNHFVEETLRHEKATEIVNEYKKVFPAAYQNNFTINEAIEDIYFIEQLSAVNKTIFRLYKRQDDLRGCLNLKTYALNVKIDLYKIMPILENLGFNAIEERVFQLDKKVENRGVFIQEFVLDVCKKGQELESIKENVEDAIARVYQGVLKNDLINNLILNANLNWRQVYLLNAYCKYLLQIKTPHSQEFIKNTLVKHPILTRKIVAYFYSKFEKKNGQKKIELVRHEVQAELEKVLDNIEDKVFKKLIDVIDHTVRTNFFQKDTHGEFKNYISFKFDSQKIIDIPLPIPFKEIFVFSSVMEGIHLRGGKVSRGGLRWSDHPEDYRNEVLGLMKAQMTKNAVIVPDGSKGGFVLKNMDEYHSRDEIFAAGIKAYKVFLSGLLDITDNIVNNEIVKPQDVICYDEDDPYLVVAADKGTATFSDTANEISQNYNFWLGDAFASGGSAGYDHKKMGITAKGAWVSVSENLKSLNLDVDQDDFTVVGIGDMSGDVFGNGMLCSKHIRLHAAFNHMHIFVDPNPCAASSYKERKRLFDLPRSSWEDYNKDLISPGGGVFSRKAKYIDVTPEMADLFSISEAKIEPDHLIKKILCASVDLLWNGGIGTYVKSSKESHENVGDKPNDNLRVNGHDLKCKVVGEGGNLGFTQLGRVEYALNGGIINTDFIDNSAGVDCSDHEVNIKIAFGDAIEKGKIDIVERNKILDQMQSEVADLVLKDNLLQNTAISISHSASINLFEIKTKLIDQLKESINLNPELEFLPNSLEIARRGHEKLGFTRPEISVLLAYSKLSIYKNLINSKLAEDEYFKKYLVNYFPSKMQDDFMDEILNHKLRKEIIITGVSNHIVNHIGSYFFHDAQGYSGLQGCDIVRSYHIVWEIFKLEELWRETKLISKYSLRLEIYYKIRLFMQTSIYWFLRNIEQPLDVEETISIYSEKVGYLIDNIHIFIEKFKAKKFNKATEAYKEKGLSEDFARKLAILEDLYSAMDIANVSIQANVSVSDAVEVYFSVGQKFYYDWLINKASALQTDGYWKRMLTKTIKDDIYDQKRTLTTIIINTMKKVPTNNMLDKWCDLNKSKINVYNKFIDSIRSLEEIDYSQLVVSIKKGEVLVS